MMKGMNKIRMIIPVSLIALCILISVGCSDRSGSPVIESDSTIIYPSKNSEDVSAGITFYRKLSSKTGKLIGEGTVFTIQDKENVRATIDLENLKFDGANILMFHVDWIAPDGNSIYQKRIDLSQNDSTSTLSSSISIPPDKRFPGTYTLKVYYFRELIAEKRFYLITEEMALAEKKRNAILADITFFSKVSKKTGKRSGEGTIFTAGQKEKVYAIVNLGNLPAEKDINLIFYWKGPDGDSFYSKQINLAAGDTLTELQSSITIPSNKRSPGSYVFQVSHEDEIISEKNFELVKKK